MGRGQPRLVLLGGGGEWGCWLPPAPILLRATLVLPHAESHPHLHPQPHSCARSQSHPHPHPQPKSIPSPSPPPTPTPIPPPSPSQFNPIPISTPIPNPTQPHSQLHSRAQLRPHPDPSQCPNSNLNPFPNPVPVPHTPLKRKSYSSSLPRILRSAAAALGAAGISAPLRPGGQPRAPIGPATLLPSQPLAVGAARHRPGAPLGAGGRGELRGGNGTKWRGEEWDGNRDWIGDGMRLDGVERRGREWGGNRD